MNSPDPIDPHDQQRWRQFVAGRPIPETCTSSLDLARYLDGRATPDEADVIEAHLAACTPCLDSVIESRRLAGGETMPFVPPSVQTAAQGLVSPGRVRTDGPLISVLRVGRWGAAVAASLVICVLGYRAGLQMVSAGDPSGVELASAVSFGVFDGTGDDDAEALVVYALAIEEAQR